MSKLFIEDSTLTAIADAIRDKAGIADRLTPGEMPLAIQEISGGGAGDFEVTNGALARNFYSIDAADIPPYTFVDYFEGGEKKPAYSYITNTISLSDGLERFKVVQMSKNEYLFVLCDPGSQLKVVKGIINEKTQKLSCGSMMSLGSTMQEHVFDIVRVNDSIAGALYCSSTGELKACLLTASTGSTYLTKKSEITISAEANNKTGEKKVALGYEPVNNVLIAFFQLSTGYLPLTFCRIAISGTTLTAGELYSPSTSNVYYNYANIARAEFLPNGIEGQLLFIVDGSLGNNANYAAQGVTTWIVKGDDAKYPVTTRSDISHFTGTASRGKRCDSAVTLQIDTNHCIHFYTTTADMHLHTATFQPNGTYGATALEHNAFTINPSLANVLQALKLNDTTIALVYRTAVDTSQIHVATYTHDGTGMGLTQTGNILSFDSLHGNCGAFLTHYSPNTLMFYYMDKTQERGVRVKITYDAKGALSGESLAWASASALFSLKNNNVGYPLQAGENGYYVLPMFYASANQIYIDLGGYFAKSTVTACTSQSTVPAGTALGITKTKCGVDVPGTIYKYIQ